MVDVYNPFSLINALKQSRVRPFKTDKRQVIGLGIELDENGKGILDWEKVELREYLLPRLNENGHGRFASRGSYSSSSISFSSISLSSCPRHRYLRVS